MCEISITYFLCTEGLTFVQGRNEHKRGAHGREQNVWTNAHLSVILKCGSVGLESKKQSR